MHCYRISPYPPPDTCTTRAASGAFGNRIVRKRTWHNSVPLAAVLIAFLFAASLNAQSTVVSINRDAEVPIDGQTLTVDRVSSDLSPTIKVVERRLASATPETWRSERTMGRLIRDMNQAGYRVFLHETAIDNNLDPDTVIRLALYNASIDENLRFVLNVFRCDYQILDSGTIVIASNDKIIEDPVRITFDITNLPQDPYLLADTIEETIDPDGWEVNGGTGRLKVVATNDRRLLVVVTTYQNLRQIRTQLGTFSKMTGAGGLPTTQNLFAGTSAPVTMSGTSDDRGYDRGYHSGRWGRGAGFGGGGGGGGLGGGVF